MKYIFLAIIVYFIVVQNTNTTFGNKDEKSEFDVVSFYKTKIHNMSGFNAYEKVTFRLWLQIGNNVATDSQVILIDNIESLRKSNFDPKKPTRILVNGWNGPDRRAIFSKSVRKAYLKYRDYNVITVDWSKSTRLGFGSEMAAVSGIVTGMFIEFLCNQGNATMSDMMVLSQSMGAYLASMTGKYLKGQLPYMYLFDPSRAENKRYTLEPTDAEYVEVIHSGCKRMGVYKPMGDADFYLNSCNHQPGCIGDIFGTCSHQRGHVYFKESLTNSTKGFWGIKCSSFKEYKRKKKCAGSNFTALMGGDPPQNKEHGIFWVRTNREPPFAKGKYIAS